MKNNIQIKNQLLQLKQERFTGQIHFKTHNQSESWKVYLFLGRIIWAENKNAWQRNLNKFCPTINLESIKSFFVREYQCQEYYILNVLVQQKLIEKKQAVALIKSQVIEILFDLWQQEYLNKLSYQTEAARASSFLASGFKTSLPLVEVKTAIDQTNRVWHNWVTQGLAQYSPNLAPIIKDHQQLKQQVNAQIYQNLVELIDGTSSLRKIAFIKQKDVSKLTCSLLPYVQQKIIELTEPGTHNQVKLASDKPTTNPQIPLVACIDDSAQVCQIMLKICSHAGYRFISIQDSFKALPSLISSKPDIIFLDLGMPIVNGYEICSQIRRVSSLQNIPVIILTGRDGLLDRMRAKVVGATDFLTKPIDIDEILSTLDHHFPNYTVSPTNPPLAKISTPES